MGEKINWKFTTQAVGGPIVSGSGAVEPDSYEKVNVTIPSDNNPHKVKLAFDANTSFIVINPLSPHKSLSYTVDGKTAVLDGPHVFIGAGAVTLLGAAAEFAFTNDTGADAVIEMMVGRDATP